MTTALLFAVFALGVFAAGLALGEIVRLAWVHWKKGTKP